MRCSASSLTTAVEARRASADRHRSASPSDRSAEGLLHEGVVVMQVLPERPFNALFLCTGNSARSIMAEAILNKLGAGKFHAYSAGSRPKGQVHPETARLLRDLGFDTKGFRSKSWNEFAVPGGPPLDFVFTVCDNAAGETCPVWSGQPMTAHWGVSDPAAVAGSPAIVAFAFKDAYLMLHRRISTFTALPIRSLEELSLQNKLREIGRLPLTATAAEPI